MRTFSDDRLVVSIAEGQEDALVEVFERHGGAVYGFTLTRVGLERAENLTRGVFLTLWRAPQVFVPVHGSLRPALLEEALGWVVDLPRARAVTARLAAELTTSEVDLEQKLRGPWARPQ
jgi:RNA polymerase sigma-70 factor (ECF subfamily)